jgi:hypothetical protein
MHDKRPKFNAFHGVFIRVGLVLGVLPSLTWRSTGARS